MKLGVHSISPALTRLARFGFGAKALVYLIIGLMAARAAFAGKGGAADEEGALITILQQPFGRVLLSVVAAGLLSYAVWRFTEMAIDPEGGKGEGRWLARFQFAVSGLVYSSLGVEAIRMIARKSSSGGGERSADEQAGLLVSLPFGHWLLTIVAIVAIGFGLYELYESVSRNFEDQWELKGLGNTSKQWVLRLGRFGIFSRAIVGIVVGAFFLIAGLRRSPEDARGTRGAIESITEMPFGGWLLALIAAGLIAYGLYTLFEARYRKLEA